MIRKILNNRIIILQISHLLFKYVILRTLLPGKVLLRKISVHPIDEIQNHRQRNPVQPFHSLLRSINKILDFLYPNGNCLVKSLVKRDLLKKYGYSEQIAVGVLTTERGIEAHAWLSGECKSNYKIVHLL